ncbi:MAG: hypothetical protein R3B99_22420 [Polyangiales bacterium]|nr:hypothetical protein [Sandaracinus sp.]
MPAALFALPALLLPSALQSQALERVPLQLDLHPCLEIDAPAVRRIVGIELAVELAETEAAGSTRVRASCGRDATLLEVDDGVTGKTTIRRIDLEGTARVARSRLLALAIAELVSASWAELRLRPPSESPPVFDPVAPEAVRNVAARVIDRRLELPPTPPPPGPIRHVSRARLFLLGAFGGSGTPAHWLAGGAVEGRIDLSSRLTLGLGIDLLRGRWKVAPDDVREDRLGWSASLAIRRPVGEWWLAGGLGGRVGRARLTGRGEGSRTLSAPYGGAFLFGETWRVVWRRLLFTCRVELGTVTLPVTGRVGGPDGRVVAAVDGAWAVGQVGLGIAL